MTSRADRARGVVVILMAIVLATIAVGIVLSREPHSVAAAPACFVDLALPAGSSAQLAPGESATFSYAVTVTAEEVREINVDVLAGSTSGLVVAIQPASATIPVSQPGVRQNYPVFGGITVTVPQGFAPGTYSVSAIGAYVTCAVITRDGTTPVTTRSEAREITITVAVPQPTPTPEPAPTSTPVPPPAICEPGFSLLGDVTLETTPGNRLTAQFEASVVVRRISQVTLRVSSSYQGAMNVSLSPSQNSYSFESLPADTVLRTFSGTVTIDVPANQPPGTYTISGLQASATCQGVDAAGAPTTFGADSSPASISVRVWPLTPTQTPTSTATATATATVTSSPTATATVTPTASPTPSASPTVTATGTPATTPTPTGTITPTPTPTGTITPTATPTSTPTPLPTSTQPPTSTPRSIVRSPVASVAGSDAPAATATPDGPPATSTIETSEAAPTDTVAPAEPEGNGAMVLDWRESRELFADQSQTTGWLKLLAGVLAALLLAGGSAGAWHARNRSSR